MSFPTKIPGLKWITAVYALYALIWISLEGNLTAVTLMGSATTAVLLLYLAQTIFGGRELSMKQWLGITAVWGLLFGLGCGVLTLFFMVLKTGLHAHGPEFTPAEVNYVMQQTIWWAMVGLLAGIGLGMISSIGRN